MRATLSLILTLALFIAGFAALAEADQPIRFRDPVFERKVREALGAPDGPITRKQAEGLGELNLAIDGGAPDSEKVHDLSDAAHFPNLFNLSAPGNAIRDLSPLSGLTGIKFLDLGGNPLKSLKPVEKLASLQELAVWYCGLKDLSPLIGLSNLTVLDAKGNAIKNVEALAGLTALERLDL